MKIIYVTDLHGSKWKFERLLNLANDLQVDVVINGGDILPKDTDLSGQKEFITNYLDNYLHKFNSSQIYYICYFGNDDPIIFDQLFEKTCIKYSFVVNIAQRKFKIKDYEFVGMNWVVDYPFLLKDRCRIDMKGYRFQEQSGKGLLSTQNGWKEINNWFEYAKKLPTIEYELNHLVQPANFSKSVYIIHMPPAMLGLDNCYGKLKIGSRAIYNFLKKNQPKLSLHGHVHESPEVSGKWYAKLDNTICIQPGQLEEFTYVNIDLSPLRFKRTVQKK